MTTLMSYSQEIAPQIRELIDAKDVLKSVLEEDLEIIKAQEAVKDAQQSLKDMIEDRHSTLVREIKDLETDIKLAVKAAAKGTDYSPTELKAFFVARAKASVDKVVQKGELFTQLESELS